MIVHMHKDEARDIMWRDSPGAHAPHGLVNWADLGEVKVVIYDRDSVSDLLAFKGKVLRERRCVVVRADGTKMSSLVVSLTWGYYPKGSRSLEVVQASLAADRRIVRAQREAKA